MTVRDLIEANMYITDVEISLRNNDGWLLNQLNIGMDYGVKRPYPTQVPIEEKYAGNTSQSVRKDAIYLRKSINTYDDGKEYFQVKFGQFPRGWLDLEVFSWRAGHVYAKHHDRQKPVDDWFGIRISARRYEDTLIVLEEPKAIEQKNDQIDGQIDIYEWLEVKA